MIGGLLIVLFVVVWLGARRYERRQRQLGRWDEHGPLVETAPPPLGKYGTIMTWQLEALGKLRARVVRRRKLHEPPS